MRHFSNDTLIWITDALRRFPEHRERLLDCFWRGQIESKAWLIDTLNDRYINPAYKHGHNVYIFGGWYGVLAAMLFDSAAFPINKIRSIDIDPACETVADHVNKPNEMAEWRFKSFTASMDEWKYDHTPTLVINTSCEHVSQEVYDRWFNQIPDGTLVVLQGNDFFSCEEHVRCSADLEEFKTQSRLSDILYAGTFKTDAGSGYNRFMLIGEK
jgi:hypothetical protein